MTYTPEQIAAHIEMRAAAVGENSADVRILRQLVADNARMREALGTIAETKARTNADENVRRIWSISASDRAALSTQETPQ